ncbi:hypothetical protein HQQ94_08265 [Shewanella sp. VB17]|uniref:hypothetical protein n=1 Tax=Shewanella sp. VB17 TaxID=2739432 RepID=UPI0015653059|nr:hypothetical protein [Shewanella sp. VB17]NRD73236.1 hypothetical protein [Shewanella sp. VB17]
MSKANKAAFEHILSHYRGNKQSLVGEIKILIDNDSVIDNARLVNIAKYCGALDCLYWQALGNDLTNLAKGIRRTLTKAHAFHGIEGL